MIAFPPYPILVHTPLGDGWVLYVTPNGMSANDEITVTLAEDGQWRHFTSDQIKSHKNATYGIVSQGEGMPSLKQMWERIKSL